MLSHAEVEQVLALPDVQTAFGLRDRARLETFYSTGARRAELIALTLTDLDAGRGVVFVRKGKGDKDRCVPIGERALAWIQKYIEESRPNLLRAAGERSLFLTWRSEPFGLSGISYLVSGYVKRANLGKTGSCHVFRHAMATEMLEGGADVRFIQEILGHSRLTTTAVYTKVSIAKLKQVHTATHPAAMDDDAEVRWEVSRVPGDQRTRPRRALRLPRAAAGSRRPWRAVSRSGDGRALLCTPRERARRRARSARRRASA